MSGYAIAVPNAQFDISSWQETDGTGTATAEGVYRGTNAGPFRTPRGEMQFSVPFDTVFATQGAKLSVHRPNWDNATFMAQLGLAG